VEACGNRRLEIRYWQLGTGNGRLFMADEHAEHKSHGGGGHGPGGGHGGGAHEEHEGAPEWLISFADNVALMMGFFVIMLAMAMNKISETSGSSNQGEAADGQPSTQMLDFTIGVREAFNNPIRADNPNDAALWRRLKERQAEAEAKTKAQRGSDRDVKTIRKSEYFGMGGVIQFESRSATLDEAAREALADILRHRRGLRNIIEIHGHVSAAEAYDVADRGMDLSWRRARAVAEALVEAGIGWNQLKLIGCADNDRKAVKTYDQFGHRANQRVEIIEIERSMQVDEPEAGQGERRAAPAEPDAHSP
jgi:flagellar motor protein MotB